MIQGQASPAQTAGGSAGRHGDGGDGFQGMPRLRRIARRVGTADAARRHPGATGEYHPPNQTLPAQPVSVPTDRPTRRGAQGPRPLLECGLAGLARKAAHYDALDRALRQTLPAPLRDQVRLAELRGRQLVFLASSPVWASRLRLLQAQILAGAQSLQIAAASLRVKVVPLPAAAVVSPELPRALSAQAAKHLRHAAAGCDDPELRRLYAELAQAKTSG